jgi:hypothetical protein
MKTTNLKYIAYALAALMLMQSCSVYHSKTATVEEAVMSQKRVLVKNQVNKLFSFKYLIKEGDQLYGITKRNSTTAKKLFIQIKEDKSFDKMVGVLLPEETIKEIRLHNKSLSTILSIGIPVVIVGGIIVAIAISLSNMSFSWNIPPGTFPY